MRLHPVAAAEIKDDEIVSLINGKDGAPNAHFPARHGPALFLIFQLRGALSYGLQFFGKQTFLALPAVELLAGVIELRLPLNHPWRTGSDRGWLVFFDLLFLGQGVPFLVLQVGFELT